MSMIIEKKDLMKSETRQILINKILADFDKIASSSDETFQIDIYPCKTKKYYTTGEIAKVFQVSDRMVRKWCEQGRIQAVQTPGGAWRIYTSQFPKLPQIKNFQATVEQINKRFQDYPEVDDFE